MVRIKKVLVWSQEAAQAREVLVWSQEAAQAREVLVWSQEAAIVQARTSCITSGMKSSRKISVELGRQRSHWRRYGMRF
jgi:hypothetical protein